MLSRRSDVESAITCSIVATSEMPRLGSTAWIAARAWPVAASGSAAVRSTQVSEVTAGADALP